MYRGSAWCPITPLTDLAYGAKRTRPLCPYPQIAKYNGDSNIDDAANFECVAP